MRLERLALTGFKSFAKKTTLVFDAPVVGIVGPNGSGKSNIAEACRWVLGEQSLKSLRGRRGEDFIWHGSPTAARSNRASVAITFDNRDQVFPVAASEIEISREVYREGTNHYLINQSEVRFKDLAELLHQVSLGPSGYHIISQGEADRILNASPRDRREIVEVALGLRLYQWQMAETEKKLLKTEENLRQVELLRQEVAPHLRFLKKEMEKLERVRVWRRELKELALDYFGREAAHLAAERARLVAFESGIRFKLEQLVRRLDGLAETAAGLPAGSPRFGLPRGKAGEAGKVGETGGRREQLAAVEKHYREFMNRREILTRRLGQIEGLIEAGKRFPAAGGEIVEPGRVSVWIVAIETVTEQVKKLVDLDLIRVVWEKISAVVEEMKQAIQKSNHDESGGPSLKTEFLEKQSELEQVDQALIRVEAETASIRKSFELETAARAADERVRLELKFEISAEQAKLDAVGGDRSRLEVLQAEFNRELAEAAALTDRELLDYQPRAAAAGGGTTARAEQTARQKKMERLKIKLEEAGFGSGAVAAEYEQATAREAHLAREVGDLETSIKSLNQVIADLKRKIDDEFAGGLERINHQFQEFFVLLFGGGRAALVLIEEKREESETAETILGLEIDVTLPRKRIRGLEMLSGGERSLTSIALLFALSRVHPPPFMVLDETDAALDEVNSRKYGEMVATLAKETQLILITHNRETMSRADVIYGVTMGADGVSRLLSIKFDEAVEYAKT
ncbi:MAG: AAA family ATPase [Candidatus Vogelbacteria bacterium]|nr:AAA family ATPase [Candidatus Vogelbacteria bacterium]